MSATIQDLCGKILLSVRSSNLNYSCQETPYSIYLTIRKTWIKHHQPQYALQADEQCHRQPPESKSEIELKDREIHNLRSQVDDLKDKLKASKCAEDELRNQVDSAAVEVNRQKKETEKVVKKKDNEIDILKRSIQASTANHDKLCYELQNFKKTIKYKDDEIHNSETFKGKNLESLNIVKKEVKGLKTENKKLV